MQKIIVQITSQLIVDHKQSGYWDMICVGVGNLIQLKSD